MLNQLKSKLQLRNIITYCLGLFIMALGVAFSVRSNLGVSPVNSIPYVVSRITGVEMGICTTAVFIGFIFIQILIMRRDFKWLNLLQIICSSLFGFFVTLANVVTQGLPECSNYIMRLGYLGISMVLVALGILLYLTPELLSLPGEGVMQAVSLKIKKPLSTAKIGFDSIVVVVATALSLIFLKKLDGVREGTVIAAIGVGQFLRIFSQLWKEKIINFLNTDTALMEEME
jgi:uncharacterized membrane protein YczE